MFLLGDGERNPTLKSSDGYEAVDRKNYNESASESDGGSYEEIDDEWETQNTQV